MSMTTLARRVARRAGLSISRYPPPNSLARLTRQAFAALEIDCVVDVGAFRGTYVGFLRNEVGFDGHVLSFEPAAASFQQLQATWSGDPRWRGLPYGLGSKRGTAPLNVFALGDLNSLLSPSDYGSQTFAPLAGAGAVEEVDIRRLDEVLPELLAGIPIPSPSLFLKIDAQGTDMDVIEGARGVLPSIAALQLELSVRPIYREQPSLPLAITRLAELGFELLGVFPVVHDGLRVIEFDGLFCRAAQP